MFLCRFNVKKSSIEKELGRYLFGLINNENGQ